MRGRRQSEVVSPDSLVLKSLQELSYFASLIYNFINSADVPANDQLIGPVIIGGILFCLRFSFESFPPSRHFNSPEELKPFR